LHSILVALRSLLGGDKTDDPGWYDRFVPVADDLFDEHLKALKKEQKKKEQKEKRGNQAKKKKKKQ